MTDVQDPLKGKRIFGIDLGTTNSGIAVWDEARGGPVMLPGPDGDVLLPSVVAWDREKQEFLVGRAAEAVRRHSPRRAAYSVKRFIGRGFAEAEVKAGVLEMPYRLVAADAAGPLLGAVIDFGGDGGGPALGVPDVSAHVLARLRAHAAAALGLPAEEVRHAVITVPAYFNHNQREATRLAGQLAGWDVIDLLDEPTAAALAYGDTVLGDEERLLLVCDLGGGTFDVSLLDVGRDAAGYWFHGRVADGDTHLGGDDIDADLVRWLAAEVERRHGGTVRLEDHAVRDGLRRAAERAKVALSEQESVSVALEGPDLAGPAPVVLSRGRLELCAEPVRRRVRAIVRRAVEEVAGVAWGQISEVILVGGQTLMPAVQRDLEELTGRRPRVNDRPQLAVALGAAVYAHILSLGREQFHRNSLIPVIALALGIKLEDNTFEQLVPANATLPYTSRPYLVTTTEDNQPFVKVEVLQGPRHARRADECVVLDTIEMEVLPAPARTPRIEVRFDARADATLRIEVVDPRRDRREPRTIDLAGSRALAWRPQEGPPGLTATRR
jgi:molecular chaperone DnaK